MTAIKHAKLVAYSFFTWLAFYLIGLPDYYQSWPMWSKVVICLLVTLMYFPVTRYTLHRYWKDERHLINSLWLAFYLTVPLFIYDYLLLGLYFKIGITYVIPYWYLTFFYFSFWIQFPWIGHRLECAARAARSEAADATPSLRDTPNRLKHTETST
ncbi:MAG: hypothetical protein AAF085_17855 [Planctomycetota bacterium]